ncbi:Arsenical pump-driving ATPase [Thermococcus nautili]|uniref:ArsA family ATPase n=1 Tax=Thermococcus nautili TaxID=195522 RepID=UPI0025530074|nr:ArsA family ATPase [Thermococcus nautili]CAI1493493.1 Arsenical pump-driving ATPase [Thermococcus nautili]
MLDFLQPKKGYRVLFFIGKGGVGKTTSSAATAVALAERGYRTLIVSLDPAHNLGDVFMVKLSDRPKKIAENLYASELDMEGLIKAYLKHLEESMKHTYRYLTVINLEKYFEVLRYSPGIEEYATLEAVREILEHGDEWDVIVFDTPPTGLTLRVLALPRISIIWADKLIQIRRAILERRAAIANIHGKSELPFEEDKDPVMKELKAYRSEVEFVEKIITDPDRTSVIAVMNPEMLPLYETERAYESLKKFRVPFNMIVMNKVLRVSVPELKAKLEAQERVLEEVRRKFRDVALVEIPVLPEEPRGLEWLSKIGGVIVEGGGNLRPPQES